MVNCHVFCWSFAKATVIGYKIEHGFPAFLLFQIGYTEKVNIKQILRYIILTKLGYLYPEGALLTRQILREELFLSMVLDELSVAGQHVL